MSTEDKIFFKESLEKLSAVVQFCSQYSKKEQTRSYGKVVIIDPFDRETQIERVPFDKRIQLRRMIEKFEASLDRLFSKGIAVSQDAIIRNYSCIIEREIQELLGTLKSTDKATGIDPGLNGTSVLPFSVQSTCIEVSGTSTRESSSTEESDHPSGPSKKRTPIPKDTRDLLERIFQTKRAPNSKERKVIADKCGLSPLQVRVWFTNKRMRTKS